MKKFLQLFKTPDLRKKVLSVLFLLFVFRLMASIPIPGIDAAKLQQFLSSNQLFGFLNIFSGGGISNLSIMMLGVGPYITATIIMQLLTIVFPQLKKIYYEEGAQGQAKFNRISRYITVPLAALQGYGFLNLLMSQKVLGPLPLPELIANVLVITAGSVFLMWIGELISEYKLGNGVSLIIFAGIISGLPQQIGAMFFNYNPAMLPTYIAFVVLALIVIACVTFINESERKIPVSYAKQVRGMKMYGGVSTYLPLKVNQAMFFNYNPAMLPTYIAFVVLALIVIACVTFINESERKIPVSYAKQVRGMKMYGGVSTYLPLKVNQAGVIPIIFAISLLLFPQFFAQAVSIISPSLSLSLSQWASGFFNNIPVYSLVYFFLVVLFTYFYTAITFDPEEISRNLQKSGGFIPGIRPGEATAQTITRIIHRITLWGALFLGVVAILPNITQIVTGITSLTIGGTALLIVVAVALEVMKQIESQLTVREYEGIM